MSSITLPSFGRPPASTTRTAAARMPGYSISTASISTASGAGTQPLCIGSVLMLPLGGTLALELIALTATLRKQIFAGAFSPGHQVFLAAEAVLTEGELALAISSQTSAAVPAPVVGSVAAGMLPAREAPLLQESATSAACAVSALAVRYWRRGDAFRPLGAPGRRKVQDGFTDRKIPRELRHRLPVVVSAHSGAILWVASLPPAAEVALGDDTKWALRLTYETPCRKI